jgi:CrcB protein
MQWLNTALIFSGGGIGAILRSLMTQYPNHLHSSAITQTVIINSIGSFCIGFLWELPLSMEIKCFLIIGLLGGFTTFSGFSIEFLQFLQNKTWGIGFLYVISSVAFSLILVWLGNRLHSLLF